MMQVVALLLSFIGYTLLFIRGEDFVLPEKFLGTWIGTAEYSVLGPFTTDSFVFSVAKSESGDFLLENNLRYGAYDALMGYQRFYVEGYGDTAGTLWYCGHLQNYSSIPEETGTNSFIATSFPSPDSTEVSFCLNSNSSEVMNPYNPFLIGCEGCGCANWTFSYNESDDTLHSLMIMSAAANSGSTHLSVKLRRVGPPPVIHDADMPGHGADFSCEFEPNGRDSTPVEREYETPRQHSGCPFMQKKIQLDSRTVQSYESDYRFCYTLNPVMDYRLAWSVDSKNHQLNCSVSIPYKTDNTWVAIGFRPMSRSVDPTLEQEETGHHDNFGMQGADIVVGSVDGGVRTMYAEKYVGEPVLDDSLKLSDYSVKRVEDRLVLSFTRPLISGYLYKNYHVAASILSSYADIIFASGLDQEGSRDSNSSTCQYHYNQRGLRFIDWEDPESIMYDSWKCTK